MFRNVVSTRELLSDSFSGSDHQNTHDSSYDSQQYSQLPYSQSGFSQISTQDMFTQQFPSGSQTVEINSNSQGRKPTLYEKWKNKVTPFKPAHDKTAVNIGNGTMGNHGNRQPHQTLQSKIDVSFQHQLQMNKIKAKERDERDFLQQVVYTVQDCSKEVKLTLDSVKEKLEHDGEKAEHNLQQTINTFLDDLCKHQDRILNAIQEKDSNSTRIHMLEKELALRDAKIQSLEKSLEEQKRDTADQIVRALQKELKEPQDKVEEKLSEILDTARDASGQQTQQMSQQKQQLDRQQKMVADLKKSQQTLAKDSEKRLIDEVSNLRKDIKQKDSTFLQDIGDQLKSTLEQQLEDMETHINKLLDRTVPAESELPQEQGLRKKDIQDLLKKHRDNVEKIIATQFQKQSKHHDLQLGEAVRKIAENERKDDQSESFLSLPQFEDKMGQYQDGFMKQIENLHERHMNEIKSLKADIVTRNHDKQEMFNAPYKVQAKASEQRYVWHPELNISEKFSHQGQNGMQSAIFERKHPFSHSGFNMDGTSKISNMQNRESAMVSPLTANYKKLNSRTFFSKAAFSPVATVLPQRKELKEPAMSNLVEDEQETAQVETNAQAQTQKAAKTKSKRRKRSIYGTRKRKSTAAMIISKKSPEIEKRPRYERAAKRSELSVSNSEIVSATMPKLPNDIVASRAKTMNSGTSMQQTISVPSQNRMSVYDFTDEKHPTINRGGTFIGHGYSYNSQKNECTAINSSNAVVYPTENMSPCTIVSESRESTPSMSVREIVMKRRIKCDTHTPDFNINGGGFPRIPTNPQMPIFDILSSPNINNVHNEKTERFWTYKESMKYCQPGSWRQTKAVRIQY